jgi:heterodisulfide reductase subunit A-like polyferredoxin
MAIVDEDLCSGCEACVDTCQFLALTVADGVSRVDEDRCAGCGICVTQCPEDAISMIKRKAEDIPEIPHDIEALLSRSKKEKH